MDEPKDVQEPRLWRRDGWIARVVKNEDDDGWAVEMTRVGDDEPALVGPWTMGRDKKNPKPLDHPAFLTLVKTANDVLARHAHHARAQRHKTFAYVAADGRRIRANLDLVGEDEEARFVLTCLDDVTGEVLRSGRAPAGFRLNATSIDGFLAE
jgi:hypothetical protein